MKKRERTTAGWVNSFGRLVGQLFLAVDTKGYVERDPAADLKGALHARTTTHHATITEPREIGALLRPIEDFHGEAATRAALRLAPHVFVRPGELRAAEWTEIDLDAAEWRIPVIRMKMRKPHLVPLSRQAIAILRELHPITGIPPRVGPHYVFPSVRTRARPMSENTINAALRRLGYSKEQMTGHGFRAMATTRLSESGQWNRDAIERQLAHIEQSKSRKPYDHAQHIKERRRMMQWWSDYLDSLRDGGKVVPLTKKQA